ncbi:MAG: hypothetical protein KGN02_05250 [bacterium]|nr:hypothetical protein [bacterium]
MKRYQFDRIIRSVAQLTGNPDVLVIGSQAILGIYGDIADEVITRSPELDVSSLASDETFVHEIAGALGEMSPFSESNDGAYADSVVAEEVALLPMGWRERLIVVSTPAMITPGGVQAKAHCLHPTDVIVSKYMAGRGKDYEYCRELIRQHHPEVTRDALEQGIRDIAERAPHKSVLAEVALVRIAEAFESS